MKLANPESILCEGQVAWGCSMFTVPFSWPVISKRQIEVPIQNTVLAQGSSKARDRDRHGT